jgi:hypothetical protein
MAAPRARAKLGARTPQARERQTSRSMKPGIVSCVRIAFAGPWPGGLQGLLDPAVEPGLGGTPGPIAARPLPGEALP